MGVSGGSAGQANELSGFGFPEPPTAVEACRLGSCYRNNEPLVTDLYCHDHGRFLPLIGVPVGVRAFVAIVSSLLIYGAFELTAETGSRTPVYIVYSAIFLCFIAIPLRHFPRTASIAVLIWLFGSLTVVISRVTPGRFHVIAGALIMVGAAIVFAGYAIAGTSSVTRYRHLSRDYRAIVTMVAVALIVAAWSALDGLLVRYSADVLPGAESGLSTVMLTIGLICVAIAALIVSVSGGVLGAGRVQTQVPRVTYPGRPTWVPPATRSPGARAYRAQNALDMMIETFAWVMYLIAVAAGNALVIVGRVLAYCLALAGYALACAVIAVTNLVIRLVVLTVRWTRAAIVAAARMTRYAVITACRAMADAVVSVLVPAGVLFGAPWLVLAMAGQSRQYLRHGSFGALGLLIILLVAVSALLLGVWVILANQHPRESFRSAGRSIPVTVGYGLVTLLFGGWLLGIPGEFGYGHIRLGLITYVLSGGAVIAVIWHRVGRRASQASSPPSAPGPPAYSGRGWSVGVALAMVAGTVTGLALFPPWTGSQVGQPTRLVAVARTVTSATITWSAPPGPQPMRYVIEQDSTRIGSVPGAASSYRATGLAPGTAYTFRVIAVQGNRQSPASTAITIETRTPPVWEAALTGQWTVHYARVTTQNLNGSPGFVTDTWTFTPKCGTSQCPVEVAGDLAGNGFTATLRLSGRLYAATATDSTFIYCGSTPVTATLTLKIGVLRGAVTEGRWSAISWSGSLLLSSAPTANCGGSTVAASTSASR
jgi:Fibronectin type III domain